MKQQYKQQYKQQCKQLSNDIKIIYLLAIRWGS